MQTGADGTPVRCVFGELGEVQADLICVPVFEDEGSEELRSLDAALGGSINRARASGELRGKTHELFFADVATPTWRTRRVLLVGAGARARYDTSRARTVAGAAGLAARDRRVRRLVFVCRAAGERAPMAQAAVEGVLLGAFRDTRYKSEDNGSSPLTSVEVYFGEDVAPQTRAAVERGVLLAGCSNLARELTNEPGNLFTPRVFADRACELASGPHTTVEVLDEQAIAAQGMGLLQGVAQGSVEPPRVIVMRYEPEDAVPGPVLGLVGKGVTFDSGGLSIKTADGMERMKCDMAGGGAVVCAMRAIGRLAPSVRVIGVVPAAENMPGGRAIRPGDVLTAANGKRVEVLNTDAEGRLILGDALTLAQRFGATHLVDIATLTGACVVALGHHASGLLGAPDAWVESVRQVADRAGERVWPLPMFEEYAEQLQSEIADLTNVGGRPGGAITAGMFLKAFSGGLPWAHLDIAGTAWYDTAQPHHTKGATGVGVRTLAALPFEVAW